MDEAKRQTVTYLGEELDAAHLLVALVECTGPVGLGNLDPGARQPFTVEDAEQELAAQRPGQFRFDYLRGRPLKVRAENGEHDQRLYDRDAGPGAFAEAVKRAKQRAREAQAAKSGGA